MNRSQKNCLFSNHRIWIAAVAYPWNPRAMGKGIFAYGCAVLKFLTYCQAFLFTGQYVDKVFRLRGGLLYLLRKCNRALLDRWRRLQKEQE